MKSLLIIGVALVFLSSCQLPSNVETPTLYDPENNSAVATAYPDLDWSGVDDASCYQIQIDDASNFETPVIDAMVGPSEYEPAHPLDNGDYWWRVRAWLCAGGT